MSLKELFFNAFESRPRPSSIQIIRSDVSVHEVDELRQLLATKTPTELTNYDLRTVVESNLWLLTPEAFLYFLPSFLHAALESYTYISVFVSELIGALIKPRRKDIVNGLNQLDQNQSELGFPDGMIDLLREQQLEWFDSGTPAAIFHDRFDNLTNEEGASILAFLIAFQKAHGEDFPFRELETAIERYWARYGDS